MPRPPIFTYTITITKQIPGLTLETIVTEIKNQYPRLPAGSSIHSLASVIIKKHQPDIPELELIIMAESILRFYRVSAILIKEKRKELT